MSGAILDINLSALAQNYRRLAAQSSAAQCAAVVKADAYGLGFKQIVPALYGAGCRWFFVATEDEAQTFAKIFSLPIRIAVLNGIAPDVAVDPRLVPVINTAEAQAAWRDTGRPVVVHIDTGMNRQGLDMADFDSGGLDIALVMSHLACAEITDHPLNARQLAVFQEALKKAPGIPASLSNSSGVFLGPDYHFDLLRPGAALYGINPTPGQTNPMQPVVTLRAPVLQCRTITGPATVGYGATHALTGKKRIATLGIGYADGMLRSLGNRGRVFYDGLALPIIGQISMDMITVDATASDLQHGDYVEILGTDQSVDDLAADAGTIGYEILTGLGVRCDRQYDAGAGTGGTYDTAIGS